MSSDPPEFIPARRFGGDLISCRLRWRAKCQRSAADEPGRYLRDLCAAPGLEEGSPCLGTQMGRAGAPANGNYLAGVELPLECASAGQKGFLGVSTRPASSAYGFAQAIDGTWDWYRKETGNRKADRTKFEDAADFVGWYMAKSRSSNSIEMHDAFNHYLAYHEGHRGHRNGSYRAKPWLLKVAASVVDQTARYNSQLPRCS